MTNQALFEQAQRYIPGGVNSPVRAFKSVGGTPIFIKHASGPYLYDMDDTQYIDYVGSWGPMILGHAHPSVIQAVQQASTLGLSYGAPTHLETTFAELICTLMPSMEQVRFVNSGTEATMTAIRLARGYTGRDKIIKFHGCYHGHSDSLLVKAGSGALTFGVPSSLGVPNSVAEHTLVAEFNDLNSVKSLFEQYPQEIAGVIIEPIAGNMNCILPDPGYLQALHRLCQQYGAVYIFDEVMTGFRVSASGAQGLYGINPDLTCLGKIIGAGLPVAALGGKRDIMQHLAPIGGVYQAGTLSGNPLGMAAGLAQLHTIQQTPNFYERLAQHTDQLAQGLRYAAQQAGIALQVNAICGMLGVFFTEQTAIRHFTDVSQCDLARFNQFFHAMLAQGIYLPPSAYETWFVSITHDDQIINQTIHAAQRAFSP